MAKFLEKNNGGDQALLLLKEALDDIEEHNQPHLKGDILNTYISIVVEKENYDEGVKIFKNEIEKNKTNPKNPPYTVSKKKIHLSILF